MESVELKTNTTPLSKIGKGCFFIKKLIAVLISIMLCVCLGACSNADNSTVEEAGSVIEQSTIIASSEGTATENAEGDAGTTAKPDGTSTSAGNNPSASQNNQQNSQPSQNSSSSQGSSGSTNAQTTRQSTTVTTTKKPTTTTTTTKPATVTCSIKIECSSILSNMDKLKAGHEAYVPSSGVILSSTSYTLSNGATAYDLLSKACSSNGIPLNATNSMYGKYVAGINNLDEKDCGSTSGWMYMVNGSYPNVSCDKKVLSNGDSVTFTYTCG